MAALFYKWHIYFTSLPGLEDKMNTEESDYNTYLFSLNLQRHDLFCPFLEYHNQYYNYCC